jgi:hypothetical protein
MRGHMHIETEVHSLLHTTRVAMLATVGEALPLASAVPFVPLNGWIDLLLHLSTLAAHTECAPRSSRIAAPHGNGRSDEKSSRAEAADIARNGSSNRLSRLDVSSLSPSIHRPFSRGRRHDGAGRFSTLATAHTDGPVHRRLRSCVHRACGSAEPMATARSPRIPAVSLPTANAGPAYRSASRSVLSMGRAWRRTSEAETCDARHSIATQSC